MTKKFELSDLGMNFNGRRLYRIRCLRPFGRVRLGELGGFVECESNLSQEHKAWIYGDAKVTEAARVLGNASIGDNAVIRGKACVAQNARIRGAAEISGNAIVMGSARILRDAEIGGSAIVKDEAFISDSARISGHAKIQDHAMVCGASQVSGRATIYGAAIVTDNARVAGDAQVFGNAQVKGNAEVFGTRKTKARQDTDGNTSLKSRACIFKNSDVNDQGRRKESVLSEPPSVDWIERSTFAIAFWPKYSAQIKRGAWPIFARKAGQSKVRAHTSPDAASTAQQVRPINYPTLRVGAWPLFRGDLVED
ncbi:MAG: hypothetical protein AAF530_13180 [Pseudomonadota bacterium]